MRLDIEKDKQASENLYQGIALELAFGCSLPHNLKAWPTGLVSEWNDFSCGSPDFGGTIGDMARAFLAHRLTRLSDVVAA